MSRGNWYKRWFGRTPSDVVADAAVYSPEQYRDSAGDVVARRLREAALDCVEGRLPKAMLDLAAWCREPLCPVSAQVLLASLYMRHGQIEDARKVVEGVTHSAGTLSLLDRAQLCLEIMAYPHRARAIAESWCESLSFNEAQAQWVRDISDLDTHEHKCRDDACVRQLADELLDQLDVIPTLVAAQKRDKRDDEVHVLRAALRHVLRELDDSHEAVEMLEHAVAELADIAGDAAETQRWAHRSIGRNPYSATMALLLAKVVDNPAVGPTAREVLARASEANPTYPDLRAAWIRRTANDGRHDDALQLLSEWSLLQPGHPLVAELEQELAA